MRSRLPDGYAWSIPEPSTATVTPEPEPLDAPSAPSCEAASMPRAAPLTTVTPRQARPRPMSRAISRPSPCSAGRRPQRPPRLSGGAAADEQLERRVGDLAELAGVVGLVGGDEPRTAGLHRRREVLRLEQPREPAVLLAPEAAVVHDPRRLGRAGLDSGRDQVPGEIPASADRTSAAPRSCWPVA